MYILLFTQTSRNTHRTILTPSKNRYDKKKEKSKPNCCIYQNETIFPDLHILRIFYWFFFSIKHTFRGFCGLHDTTDKNIFNTGENIKLDGYNYKAFL